MKIEWIFKFLPVPIVYSKFLSNGFHAYSYWLFIAINPEFRADKSLVVHELVHCRQSWRLPLIHLLLYYTCPSYRYKSELSAYSEQLIFEDKLILNQHEKIKDTARYIFKMYDINRTEDEIFNDLYMSIKDTIMSGKQ